MLVTLEAQRWAGGLVKNTLVLLSMGLLSPPLMPFPNFPYPVAWWMTKLLVGVQVLSHSMENHTILWEGEWILPVFTGYTLSFGTFNYSALPWWIQFSVCLHFNVSLADNFHMDIKPLVVPKSVVMLSPHSWAKGCMINSHLYPQPFLKAARGDCQTVLCNRCNLRGGVARGRREAGAGVGRPVQIDTLHTRTACQTDKVPSNTLNQMLLCDSCNESELHSTEAECC